MTMRDFGGPIQPTKVVQRVVRPRNAQARRREEEEDGFNPDVHDHDRDDQEDRRFEAKSGGDVRGAPADGDEGSELSRAEQTDIFRRYVGGELSREEARAQLGARVDEPGVVDEVEDVQLSKAQRIRLFRQYVSGDLTRDEAMARLGLGVRPTDDVGLAAPDTPAQDVELSQAPTAAPAPQLAPEDAQAVARVQARVDAAQEEAAQARASVEERPSRASREALKDANFRLSEEASRLARLNSEIEARTRADVAEAARAEVRAERGPSAPRYEAPEAEAPTEELAQPQFTGDEAAAANREREQEVARQVALRRYQRGEDLAPTSRRAVREAIGISNDEAARLGLADDSPDTADARRSPGALAAGIASINAQRQATYETAKAQYDADLAAYEAGKAELEAAQQQSDAGGGASPPPDVVQARASFEAAVAEEGLELDLEALPTDAARADAINTARQQRYDRALAAYNAAKSAAQPEDQQARASFEAAVAEEGLELDLEALPTDAARADAINTARQQRYDRALAEYNAGRGREAVREPFEGGEHDYYQPAFSYSRRPSGLVVAERKGETDSDYLLDEGAGAAKVDASTYVYDEGEGEQTVRPSGRAQAATLDGDYLLDEGSGAASTQKLDSADLEQELRERDRNPRATLKPPVKSDVPEADVGGELPGHGVQAEVQPARSGEIAASQGRQWQLELSNPLSRARALRQMEDLPDDPTAGGSDLPGHGVQADVQPARSGEIVRPADTPIDTAADTPVDTSQETVQEHARLWELGNALARAEAAKQRDYKAPERPITKSDLPGYGVQAEVQDARSGQLVPADTAVDTSQETVQAMARQWELGNVLERAAAEKRRADEAARLKALGLELTAAYKNPQFLAEEEAKIRGKSLQQLDPRRYESLQRGFAVGYDPAYIAAEMEKARQDVINQQVADLRSGKALNPSSLTQTGDTLKEGLSFGGVDTRTYNRTAGIAAFKEAQANAPVVHEYGDPVYGPFEDTQEAGPSPDNPLSADRAHFEAQAKLAPLAAHTALSVAVPGYSAAQHYRRTGDIAWGDLAIDAASFIPAVGLVGKGGRMRRGLGSYGALGREAIVTPQSLYRTIRHPVKTARRVTDSVIHGGKVLADPHTIPHSALIKAEGTVQIPATKLGVDPSLLSPGKHYIRPDEKVLAQARANVDQATMMAARGETGMARLPTGEVLEIDPVPLGQTTRGALVHATPHGSIFSKELRVNPEYGPLHSAPTGAPRFAERSALGYEGPFPGYGVILDKDVIDQTVSSGATYRRNIEVERMTPVDDVLPRAQQYLQAHSVPDIGSQAYTVAVLGGKLSPRQIAELKVRGIAKAAYDVTPWGLRSKGYRIRDDVHRPGGRADDVLDEDLARGRRGADRCAEPPGRRGRRCSTPR